MSDTNLAFLEQVALVVHMLKGPWIIAGDWNFTPQDLATSKWLEVVSGVIFATQLPTCHGKTYDFFVVHKSLAHANAGVQRIEDAGFHPHFVARLLTKADARRFSNLLKFLQCCQLVLSQHHLRMTK